MNVVITKPCQGQALINLVYAAEAAQLTYKSKLKECLKEAGYTGSAIDAAIYTGNIFLLIAQKAKTLAVPGKTAARAALYSFGAALIISSFWCIDPACDQLQYGYMKIRSEFYRIYHTC